MLNNKYHDVLIGRNIFSFIIGIIKKRNGEDVVIIDDPRINLSGSWINYFSDIERRFLELIGIYYNVNSLTKVDQYLNVSENIYLLNNRHIILGSSYKHNFIELCRKLPEIFNISLYEKLEKFNKDNDIEEHFKNEVIQFVDQIFKYHNYQDFDEKFVATPFNTIFSEYLKTCTQALENWDQQATQILARQFLFVQQVIGQTFFTDSFSNFELKNLLYTAIAPKYKLNEEKLLEDLKSEYLAIGGHFKQVEIEEWNFYNNSLESLLLSSYEGHLKLDNCLVFGDLDDRFPLHVDVDQYRIFSSIMIQVDYPESIFGKYAGRYFTYSSAETLGTDFPLWQARFDSDKRIIIKYLYSRRSASKPEFHFKQASKHVFNSLKLLFPSLEYEKFNYSNIIKDGDEVWIEKFDSSVKFLKKLTKTSPNRKKFNLKMLDTTEKVKGIDYWGPQRARPSGMFSYLMELKNTQL